MVVPRPLPGGSMECGPESASLEHFLPEFHGLHLGRVPSGGADSGSGEARKTICMPLGSLMSHGEQGGETQLKKRSGFFA